jgi:predicted TIM-barrel fold metal-dependent hydrolase
MHASATLLLVLAALVVAQSNPSLTSILTGLQSKDVSTISAQLSELGLFVTIEEHFNPPSIANASIGNPVFQLLIPSLPPQTLQRLLDAGSLRLSNMTDNGIRKQVLSVGPVPSVMNDTAACQQANNEIAEQVQAQPDRYNAFAILPMALPEQAAAELERCVTQLGFKGALIDNHLPNLTFYDGTAYDVFWAMAMQLDVPIYIHPTFPMVSTIVNDGGIFAPIGGDFSTTFASSLATAAWGWHDITGLHFLRLYLGGVFVRFPKLKVILGHMGEMIPFYLERANGFLPPVNPDTPSLIDTYMANIWVTTAGLFTLPPIATVLRNTAIDRIIYSVDYPYSSSVDGLNFMAELLQSGLVTPSEWEQIAFGNVEALLGIS